MVLPARCWIGLLIYLIANREAVITMDILEKIFQERRADVVRARGEVPIEELIELSSIRSHHSLVERLTDGSNTKVISEMKKASPSAGCLREDYRPVDLARMYAESGASGISILTEPRHFMGSGEDLRQVRAVVDLPLLRKDFMCDVYQIYESAAWGADVVLLIAAGLDGGLMRELYEVAIDCGLDVLAEAHSPDEVESVLALERAIVGVNSRDLRTLTTDLSVAEGLAEMIPAGRVKIAESGIKSRADIVKLEAVGYGGFLIGETILRGDNPGDVLRGLVG